MVAGVVSVVGVLILVLLSFVLEGQTGQETTAGTGQSILDATATASPEPTADVAEATASPAATPASTPPPLLRPAARAGVPVQVANAGAPPDSASAATEALRAASFEPRPPVDGVSATTGTQVLHAEGRKRAARTVASVLDLPASAVQRGNPAEPNWSTLSGDLYVLVVIGSPEGG